MLPGATRGKVRRPFFLAVYGVEGVGKTTFAAEAPEPVFLGPEQGSGEMDVWRLPSPKTWFEFQNQVIALNSPKHSYKTAVIDSLDWLEPLAFDQICRQFKVSNIDEGILGYGKGAKQSTKLWRELLPHLEALRTQRGMNVVLIAHAEVTKFNDPQLNAEYNRYRMKLTPTSSDLIKEAVDAVLFANYDAWTAKDEQKRMRAYSKNERMMFTERRAGFDAKNRFSLPESFPLIEGQMWKDFERLARREPEAHDIVIPRILELKELIQDAALLAKVEASIEAAGTDPKMLQMIEKTLKQRISEQSMETI